MSPGCLVLALLLLCAHANGYTKTHRQQRYSIVLMDDWDTRTEKLPRYSENADMTETTKGNKKTITFSAFKKQWKIETVVNNMLFSTDFKFEKTSTSGYVYQSWPQFNNCFYIGTVDAGENEQGYAAVTSCNGRFTAYVITNLNDYMINVPLASGKPKQPFFFKYDNMESSNRTKRSTSEVLKDMHKRYIDIVPKPKTKEGQMIFVESAMFFDQSFQSEYRRRLSNSEKDLRMFAAELLNNIQTWFLHHTLGYRVWFTAKKIIFIDNAFPKDNSRWPMPSICKWQSETYKEAIKWDEVFLFTSDKANCDGIGGVAMPDGTCDPETNRRCACIWDQTMHMGHLLRTFTHEAAHPIGIPDDYKPPTSDICFSGIMRDGVFADGDWSKCTVQSLERFMHVKENTCVFKENTPSLPSNFQPPLIPFNVAWRSETEQSSTYINDEKWGAWKATDGPIAGTQLTNRDPKFASCTHTQRQSDPWIRIDLGTENQNIPILFIQIYNREDCCSNRLHNFEVRVGRNRDVRSNNLCRHHKGSVPGGKYGMIRIDCERTMYGRYVSVQVIGRSEILSVCEINVFQNVQPKSFNHEGIDCFDISRFCDDWKHTCHKDKMMKTRCPFTCGFCKKYPNMPKLDKQWKSAEYPSTLKPGCEDELTRCQHDRANNHCHVFRYACARSCKPECQEDPSVLDEKKDNSDGDKDNKPDQPDNCVDDNPGCKDWASYGECERAPHIKAYCKKSCKVC